MLQSIAFPRQLLASTSESDKSKFNQNLSLSIDTMPSHTHSQASPTTGTSITSVNDINNTLNHYDSFYFPLFLSLIAGLSTSLGAAVVLVVKTVTPQMMALSLGLAAGVMVTVSVVSLGTRIFLSESSEHTHTTNLKGHSESSSSNPQTWSETFLHCVFIGMGFFSYYLLSKFAIPEPHDLYQKSKKKLRNSRVFNNGTGHGTGSGSGATNSSDNSPTINDCNASLSSGGTNLSDNEDETTHQTDLKLQDLENRSISWRITVLMFLSLLIHNFPEGLAVVVSSQESNQLGLIVTIGILIHNIPEGICIAVPCLSAFPNRKMFAFLLATLSGLAEPIGALFALIVLPYIFGQGGDPNDPNHTHSYFRVDRVLSIVAGIMTAVAVIELIPEAMRQDDRRNKKEERQKVIENQNRNDDVNLNGATMIGASSVNSTVSNNNGNTSNSLNNSDNDPLTELDSMTMSQQNLNNSNGSRNDNQNQIGTKVTQWFKDYAWTMSGVVCGTIIMVSTELLLEV